MEQALQNINRELMTTDPEYVKSQVCNFLDTFIVAMMKNDPSFKDLSSSYFYGGSFYEKLRVKESDEFELNLVLKFPDYTLFYGEIPGHVKIQLDLECIDVDDKVLDFTDESGYVLTYEILNWFESVVHKAMRTVPHSKTVENTYKFPLFDKEDEKWYQFDMIIYDHGPGQCLELNSGSFTISIDLVPCILFNDDEWGEIYVVPMSPKKQIKSVQQFYGTYDPEKRIRTSNKCESFYRYFRLSYELQERYILKHKNFLKPCLRLMKWLRIAYNHHQIPSYYLKNLMLNLVDNEPDEFWNGPLSKVFLYVLEEYMTALNEGCLLYYWDDDYNLLENVEPIQLNSIANNMRRVYNTLSNARRPRDIYRCFKIKF